MLNARIVPYGKKQRLLLATDITRIRRLEQMRRDGSGLVYISRRMEEVWTLADRITVFRDGTLVGTRDKGEVNPGEIVRMMETVVSEQGTANLARVAGYRVAGKTGTVQKLGADGYSDQHYVAVFAGLAPASDPRLAMVGVINEPHGEEYYGGLVAAPVFSRVMTGALRVLGVMPDELPRQWQADAGARKGAGGRDADVPVSTAAESNARPVLAGGQEVM